MRGAGTHRYQRSGATTAGPQGYVHAGKGSNCNARTGQINTWNIATLANNHYAHFNGGVYGNTGSGWPSGALGGRSSSAGASEGADREAQSFVGEWPLKCLFRPHHSWGKFGGRRI